MKIDLICNVKSVGNQSSEIQEQNLKHSDIEVQMDS